MSWIIGRSAGSTQPSLGRVSLSLHSYQNPQFEMTINKISPSPHPTSRKTIHWIVLLGRVTRGEEIKLLLEITDFVSPTSGGHVVLCVIQRINYFSTLQTSFQIRGMKYLPIQIH